MEQNPIHPAIAEHLNYLGISSADDIQRYLFPSLQDLPSPFLLKSIDTAVDLVLEAIENSHDILIWGDYDVDGITAASLLILFFRDIGVETICHIPDRLTEGYGLNADRLRDFSSKMSQNKLLITVDCGIGNSDEIKLAGRYGFKTIVTDHHQVSGDRLYGDAVINPKQSGCRFPFKHLAGVGVAFYLAAAIRSKLCEKNIIPINNKINLKWFLGLVAIGTIADIMPLNGVNRLLVKAGFESIAENRQQGIQQLFTELDISSTKISSESISFRLAPAINAAGRLGNPLVPLELLTSASLSAAQQRAAELVLLNNKRKSICEEEYDKALSKISKSLIYHYNCIVILDDFHEGVLGIIASRLVERFGVPSLVCCYHPLDKSIVKGSARAPEGFDLYGAISEAANYLDSFGGHEAAAGFSLRAHNYLHFKQSFETLNILLDKNKPYKIGTLKTKFINLSISEAHNQQLLDNLMRLEPTGEGNPKPVFVDRSANFVSHSFIGLNRSHVKGVVRAKYGNVAVIGFNLAEKAKSIDFGRPCTISYVHSLDNYNGRSQWKIHLRDISPNG